MKVNFKQKFEDIDMLTFDVGTIESIAMKTREAFRDFQELYHHTLTNGLQGPLD